MRIFIILTQRGTIILLITPAVVELSVWIGDVGCGHPMAMRVCRWRIISLAVTKRAASSDLAAEAMTNLMIWAMESMAPLNHGKGSFYKRKM
jgi:hypothetical protein